MSLLQPLIWVWNLVQALAAVVVILFDFAIPIDPDTGRASPRRLMTVLLANATALMIGIAAQGIPMLAPAHAVSVVLTASLIMLNTLFLLGAYFALREGIDIMNGDRPYGDPKRIKIQAAISGKSRRYRDLSSAKNMWIVSSVAALIPFQAAWLIAALHLSIGSDTEPSFFAALYAVIHALPIFGLLLTLVEYAAGLPGAAMTRSWVVQAFASLGSFIIFSILIGLLQQNLSLWRLLSRLLSMTDDKLRPLLEARFRRAPSVVKRFIIRRFRSETDPEKQVRLVEFATWKHSFRFAEAFVRRYPHLDPRVQREGAHLLETFLASKGPGIHAHVLADLVRTTAAAFPNKDWQGQGAEPLTRLVVEALAVLMAEDERLAGKSVRQKPIQRMLAACLTSTMDATVASRAAELLTRARAHRWVQGAFQKWETMSDQARVLVAESAKTIMGLPGTTLSNSDLDAIIRTIDWTRQAFQCSPDAARARAELRVILRDRKLKASSPAVPVAATP